MSPLRRLSSRQSLPPRRSSHLSLSWHRSLCKRTTRCKSTTLLANARPRTVCARTAEEQALETAERSLLQDQGIVEATTRTGRAPDLVRGIMTHVRPLGKTRGNLVVTAVATIAELRMFARMATITITTRAAKITTTATTSTRAAAVTSTGTIRATATRILPERSVVTGSTKASLRCATTSRRAKVSTICKAPRARSARPVASKPRLAHVPL